jgi:Zn-dependent protease
LAEAAELWHGALALLPADASQRGVIERKLEALGARMERGEARGAPRTTRERKGALAVLGALLLFLVTKGKVLLLALTKGGALLSLFAFLGLYWREWGWTLALGLVTSIFLHELGHIVALRRYGVAVTAPMFVPGLGAFVSHGVLPTARIGARVAIAGPVAGALAAALALLLGALTGGAYWKAIAHLGAIMNLFNLVPVWQLDGAKAVAPLGGGGRSAYALLLVTVAVVTRDPFAVLIALTTTGALILLGRGGTGDRVAAALSAGVILGLGGVLLASA